MTNDGHFESNKWFLVQKDWTCLEKLQQNYWNIWIAARWYDDRQCWIIQQVSSDSIVICFYGKRWIVVLIIRLMINNKITKERNLRNHFQDKGSRVWKSGSSQLMISTSTCLPESPFYRLHPYIKSFRRAQTKTNVKCSVT